MAAVFMTISISMAVTSWLFSCVCTVVTSPLSPSPSSIPSLSPSLLCVPSFFQPGRQKGGASAAEEAPSAPLVLVHHGKEQRMKDEEKMKVSRAATDNRQWLFKPHSEV